METAIPPDEDDFEVNTLDDAVGTFDSNLPKEEDGELDLSGLSDSDLMDMLSGDQDLSDLGDMLSSDQDGKPLEETDSIGDFARSEMNPQEEVADKIPELTEQEDIPAQAEETASNGKNKKKKKNKKEKKEKEEKDTKTEYIYKSTSMHAKVTLKDAEALSCLLYTSDAADE